MAGATRRRAEAVLLREEPSRSQGAQVVPLPRPAEALSGLVALTLEALDEEAGQAELRVGGETVRAAIDPAVSPIVLRTALLRRERVIAQREGAGWVVLGTLRTSATPGVDVGDEYLIRARRIDVIAEHEFAVVSGKASFVVRAQGYVETLAHDITARASGIHKIIGRLIRLN